MSSLVLTGDTSGQVTLAAPAVAGSNTATLPLATGELSMLGTSGQTWSDVTASRVSGTTYTNSTGKPIQVQFGIQSSSSSAVSSIVGGVTIYSSGVVSNDQTVNFIVPTGLTYSITFTNRSVGVWAELR